MNTTVIDNMDNYEFERYIIEYIKEQNEEKDRKQKESLDRGRQVYA